jgi:5'-phosphate synthase pdxT subunit
METRKTVIGVLDLQGAVREHIAVLEQLGVDARRVRLPEELDELDGLIIPGGESTTVGKLMERYGLDTAIKRRTGEGMAVFGTCMGLIVMAQRIEGSEQQRLGLMDILVRRNAFGRQVDSFEADIDIPSLGDEPVPAVFIRAPVVLDAGPG